MGGAIFAIGAGATCGLAAFATATSAAAGFATGGVRTGGVARGGAEGTAAWIVGTVMAGGSKDTAIGGATGTRAGFNSTGRATGAAA
jgi:hypothetical protein